VVNGHTGTPPSKLPKQDVEAVTDYVRAALMVPEGEVSGTAAYGGRDRDAVTAPGKAAAESADMSQAMPNRLVADADKGRRFYNANCATCHGAKGDGKGPRAYFIYPKPRDFTSVEARAMLNRPAIYAATSMGRLGTEMPAWSKVLSNQEIANVAEYVFGTFIRPGTKTAQR
jgi:mono/diheme cytochrome c family protein